ncbi:MAG: tRNA pseudouridine(54/55) synthase Pus10 [Candidatus Aenigmarchaeota archaeon]|nr:tRNA pseudouridine(54/55) synthase Pus10 [Candidatus Aenigmarchaeota archaeon]
MAELIKKFAELLKTGYICDWCIGRNIGNLLSGFTNKERGRLIRYQLAFISDSGEKLDVDLSNFHGINFRDSKIKPQTPEKCKICKNFFDEKLGELGEGVVKKIGDIEFDTFVVGTIPSDEILNAEEKMQETMGIEFSEPIKSEINREMGKIIEKLTGKHFDLKSPDVTILVDLKTNSIKIQVKSLFIYGRYQKLVRGIPQTKWICKECNGKGCTYCKGEGKLYKTSIQEIIESPILKDAQSKKSAFHGAGREDIDARNLGWRPFVIEIVKPVRRKINLKELEKKINKSKKVHVKELKFVDKSIVRKLKSDRIDKTYFVDVEFKNKIEKKLLKKLKIIAQEPIMQKTPLRVVHRRADKMRKRYVKKFSYKIVGNKRIQFKIKAESGLYIKELISGDGGRTQPNVSELIDNKVKKMSLDVFEIHSKKI